MADTQVTGPDPAVVDRVRWLTQMDDVAHQEYDNLLRVGLYPEACDRLLTHLVKTERMRISLDPEHSRLRDTQGRFIEGPTFGVGPGPDLDVTTEHARILWATLSASSMTRALERGDVP